MNSFDRASITGKTTFSDNSADSQGGDELSQVSISPSEATDVNFFLINSVVPRYGIIGWRDTMFALFGGLHAGVQFVSLQQQVTLPWLLLSDDALVVSLGEAF